jgi:hypothetical protein
MIGGTVEQRTSALQLANHVRYVRAELKRELWTMTHAQGMVRVADVLEAPIPELENMKVLTLLKSVYRLGDSKVNRLMTQAGISQTRTVGGITGRQRECLVALLRGETGE